MLTDEQVIDVTRARLAEELSDLHEPAGILANVRHRHDRRRKARLAAGALGAALIVAVGVPLALSAGGTAQQGPGITAPRTGSGQSGQLIQLADMAFVLPKSFHVSQSSAAKVTADSGAATLRFTFRPTAPALPSGAQRLAGAGLRNYWIVQTPSSQSLYVFFQLNGRQAAIVIKAAGMSRQQLLGLVEHHGVQAGTAKHS